MTEKPKPKPGAKPAVERDGTTRALYHALPIPASSISTAPNTSTTSSSNRAMTQRRSNSRGANVLVETRPLDQEPVMEWLAENCPGRWQTCFEPVVLKTDADVVRYFGQPPGMVIGRYLFADPEDAMRFKLVWS